VLNVLLKPIYRRLVILVSIVAGGIMLVEGVYNLLTHSYIGGTLGPWGRLVRAVGLNPYHIGLVFVLLGLAWGVALFGFRSGDQWGWWAELAVAILSLWYFPLGTFLAVVCILLLLRQTPRRKRLPGIG